MQEKQNVFVPHPVDICVGRRLRARRTILGISQDQLGKAVGLTFQQIQKYERGANRIGCSRLYQFSVVLGVGVEYFFQECPQMMAQQPGETPVPIASETKEDPLFDSESLALLRAFSVIPSTLVKRRLLALVKTMSGEETEEAPSEELRRAEPVTA